MLRRVLVAVSIILVVAMVLIFSQVSRVEEELTTECDVEQITEEDVESSTDIEFETIEAVEPTTTSIVVETSKPTEPIHTETTKLVTTTESIKPDEVIVSKNETIVLDDYERSVVECMVMGEAGSESYYGQLMVAYCIRNACERDGLSPSQVRAKYQYSGWNAYPSESVKQAVREVFDNGKAVIDDTPLWFYATWTYSSWHESQRYICTIGNHKFFGEW
jgi:hypothetical protein